MFRYMADPLFLVCSVLYFLFRWLVKPNLPINELILRCYFTDFLLIPCALPPLLWTHRIFSLRKRDTPPNLREISIHLLIWSVIFEWLGPCLLGKGVADPWDVVAYSTGGVCSWVVWNRSLWQDSTMRSRKAPCVELDRNG